MLITKTYKTYLLLLISTFIFYGNSIKNEYSLDDVFVAQNPLVEKGITAIPEIFSSRYYSDSKYEFGYRPMAKSSFAIEYSLFGAQPHISHFINLLFYWLACCLLFRVLAMLMGIESTLFSFIVTLLFLAHPLHTEVVCSLKNRENLFSFIFSMVAMLCYSKYASKNSILFLLLGAISILLAFISKEDTMVYLFIIPFSLHFFKKTKISQIVKICGSFLISYLLLLGMVTYFNFSFTEKRPFEFFENPLYYDYSIIHRISMGLYTLGYYTKLLFAPYPLILYYGYNQVPIAELTDRKVIISAIIATLLLFYCIRNYKKRSLTIFGIIFFVAAISMFLNILIPVTGIIGERYAFNASVGFCIALTAMLFQLFKIKTNESGSLWKQSKWLTLTLTMTLLICFKVTFSRNQEWKDIYTLCKADIVHAPNSVKIHDLLADESLKKFNEPGTTKEEKEILVKQAITHYKESLRIYPNQAEVLNNIGLALAGYYKNYGEAISYFGQALALDSTLSEAYYNTGVCYYRQMNLGDAELNYKKAIRFNPRHLKAYFDLTGLYINMNKTDEAIRLNKDGIAHGIKDADLYLNLGDIYLVRKDSINAITFYEESLDQRPDNKKLCQMLTGYYSRNNNKKKAFLYEKMMKESK